MRSKPESLNNGKLVVAVASSAWAQELSFHKELIISRLNKHLNGADLVREVIFCVKPQKR